MVKRSNSIQANTVYVRPFQRPPGSILECSLGNIRFIFIFLLYQSRYPNSRATASWFCGPSKANMAPAWNFIYGHWKRWCFPLASLSWDDKSFNSGNYVTPCVLPTHYCMEEGHLQREMKAAGHVMQRWKMGERKRTWCVDSPGWSLESLELTDFPVQFLSHLTYFPFQIFPLCCIIRNIFGLCLQFLARSS